MPINNDLVAYHGLIDTFLAHWSAVNIELGASPLVLPDGTSKAALEAAKATLTTLYQAVESADNTMQTSSAEVARLKADLIPRHAQFRSTVNGLLPGSRYAAALTKTPSKSASQGVVVKAFQDTLTLWSQLEVDPAVTLTKPLTLADGTTRAALETGFGTLQTTYSTLATGREAAAQARSERNTHLKVLDSWMKQYRKTAQARLVRDHPLLANLPRVSR